MVPKIFNWHIFTLVFLFYLLTWTHAELFTAIADVEHLLETHKRIIDDLDDYIAKEEIRLRVIRKHLKIYKKEHEKAMEDIPNYLGNPINSFTLIKRLTLDLDYIEEGVQKATEYVKNMTMAHEDIKYPTMEDLTGAAQALTRLQVTYNLDVADLAEGMLNGVAYSTPMSASDCFELGRVLYNQKDYENSLAWMHQALKKYKDDKESCPFTEVEILEYISFSYYLMDDVRSALVWTKKLLEHDPKHARARGNIPHYEKIIEEDDKIKRKRRRGDTGEEDLVSEESEGNASSYRTEHKNYEALCRGEQDISSQVAKKLKCWYMMDNHPFLKLAPIKTEQLYSDPDIFLFYDVIYDDEIKEIKGLAKPRFSRARVHDWRTGELTAAQYRISKSAWLRDTDSPAVERVTRRIADLSGLDLRTAEELQVANYGIGGHYEPHYDFARKREPAFKNFSGNRIATVLFYMSEVSQGGATVFTELGLTVFPVKGAAVFWLNLHPSGEGNMATRHAACPVLRGSKWVSNKWLHQGGQELIRPCGLEYQEEGFGRTIPEPVPRTAK